MKTFKTISIAALSLVMAACSSDMQEAAPDLALKSGKGIPFSATISRGADTRTELTENATDKTLDAQWTTGDQVAMVYDVGGITKVTKATVTAQSDKSATITATLEEGVTNETAVNIYYPYSAIDINGNVKADLFENQTGKLDDVAANLDLHKGQGVLYVSTEMATLKKNVAMEKQAAIWKLSLTDGTNALAVDCFEIRDGNGLPLITVQPPTEPTSELYVAMMPASSQTFHFVGKNGDEEYYYSKFGATLAAGKYYQSSMPLADMLHTPLTLEPIADGKILFQNPISGAVKYRINYGDVQVIEAGQTVAFNVKAKDIVTFYGDNATYYKSASKTGHFSCSSRCYIYGNIMSLINSTNFATTTELTGAGTFYGMFENNIYIVNHDVKDLLLPATTLAGACYREMFYGCKGLTVAPALPATTLKGSCYLSMFEGCTGLRDVPALPATTLADHCYESMFSGCNGLTTLPKDLLSVTTMANFCYTYMFSACNGLTTLPKGLLPATTLAEGCYQYMFKQCKGLLTLPGDLLPATTLAKSCYYGMFDCCSILIDTPILPAGKLATECYRDMFSECFKIQSVICLATDISAENCLRYWLSYAAYSAGGGTLHVKAGKENLDWNLYSGWSVLGDQ